MQTSMSVGLSTTTVTLMRHALINQAALNVFAKMVSKAMVWTASRIASDFHISCMHGMTTRSGVYIII